MYICDRCGKGKLVGMNVSHSHIRTKKRSIPNLHSFRVMQKSGNTSKVLLCTKCLRVVKAQQATYQASRPAQEVVVAAAQPATTTSVKEKSLVSVKKSRKPLARKQGSETKKEEITTLSEAIEKAAEKVK